ncbi:MAG: DUF2310 family Zn-ribbon-containing protein [Planctomycetota bacterium]
MSEHHDPYWKLRPLAPTPVDELCSCAGSPPVMLQPHLSSNPLSCIACNLEVPPERIGFSEALAEKLAFWQSFHNCFYLLWLDSSEFESWAKAQLSNPGSAVNKRALELVSDLNSFRSAYYWWFQDTGAEDFHPPSRCPVCQGELLERYGRNVCEPCSLVVPN